MIRVLSPQVEADSGSRLTLAAFSIIKGQPRGKTQVVNEVFNYASWYAINGVTVRLQLYLRDASNLPVLVTPGTVSRLGVALARYT